MTYICCYTKPFSEIIIEELIFIKIIPGTNEDINLLINNKIFKDLKEKYKNTEEVLFQMFLEIETSPYYFNPVLKKLYEETIDEGSFNKDCDLLIKHFKNCEEIMKIYNKPSLTV